MLVRPDFIALELSNRKILTDISSFRLHHALGKYQPPERLASDTVGQRCCRYGHSVEGSRIERRFGQEEFGCNDKTKIRIVRSTWPAILNV